MSVPQYKRVVIKLSGEALAGEAGFGLSPEIIKSVAGEVKEVVDLGVEVAVGCFSQIGQVRIRCLVVCLLGVRQEKAARKTRD